MRTWPKPARLCESGTETKKKKEEGNETKQTLCTKSQCSPNERRKATRERFWGLKTKKKRHSLFFPCFKTALCYGVVSGCFVHRVSPSSRFRPELAPKRGPAAPELAFRTPEMCAQSPCKNFWATMRPCGVGVCSSDFERSAGMALNRHTRARPCGSRFRRNAAELYAGSSKFAMVNLGVKVSFRSEFFGHEERRMA